MQSLHSILFAIVSICCLAGCNRLDLSGDRQAAAAKYLEKAKKSYEQRDFLGAVSAYEELLKIQPSQTDAHFQIALIYDRNLNDYLNAAYHYQRFIQSDSDSKKVELARAFLENAKLQFAATIPNVGGQNSPELVKLRTENIALHRQIEELKRELVRNRAKMIDSIRVPEEKVAPVSSSSPKVESSTPPIVKETKSAARPRTYVVKKGEGIQAIAEKMYGDRSKWREIMNANPKLKDPNHLTPGQVLVLP